MKFACAMAGIVIVTANPALLARELRYILETFLLYWKVFEVRKVWRSCAL